MRLVRFSEIDEGLIWINPARVVAVYVRGDSTVIDCGGADNEGYCDRFFIVESVDDVVQALTGVDTAEDIADDFWGGKP